MGGGACDCPCLADTDRKGLLGVGLREGWKSNAEPRLTLRAASVRRWLSRESRGRDVGGSESDA